MTKTRIALLVLTAGVLSGSQVAYAADPAHADQAIVPPAEAMSRLKEGNGRYTPAHIQSLVAAIRPAVEATILGDLEATVKANVKDVGQALRSSTPILKPKVDSGELRVVDAYYSLDSGSVTFLGEQ